MDKKKLLIVSGVLLVAYVLYRRGLFSGKGPHLAAGESKSEIDQALDRLKNDVHVNIPPAPSN